MRIRQWALMPPEAAFRLVPSTRATGDSGTAGGLENTRDPLRTTSQTFSPTMATRPPAKVQKAQRRRRLISRCIR